MKLLMLTDTHLGYKNGHSWWYSLVEELFDEIIDVCITRNISDIVHLGDWYHDRKSLPVPIIDKSIEVCRQIRNKNINLWIIKGNHDQYYNNQPVPTSLSHLKEYSNIKIIDKEPVEFGNNILLVPWGHDIKDCPDNSILFGHFEINGFIVNYSGRVHENGKLNVSDFKKFKKVYSGHFHTPSINGNVEYIGSPFPMDFNDIGSQRGYYIFDTETEEKEFIEFTYAPKFVRIYSSEEITEDNVRDNFVEFVFTEDYGSVNNEKIVQDIRLLEPHKLYIDYKIDNELVEDVNEEDSEVTENNVIFRNFIDKKKLPENINKRILLKFLEKVEEKM